MLYDVLDHAALPCLFRLLFLVFGRADESPCSLALFIFSCYLLGRGVIARLQSKQTRVPRSAPIFGREELQAFRLPVSLLLKILQEHYNILTVLQKRVTEACPQTAENCARSTTTRRSMGHCTTPLVVPSIVQQNGYKRTTRGTRTHVLL